MDKTLSKQDDPSAESEATSPNNPVRINMTTPPPALPLEIGGPDGPEPTRYGDWERNGRCTDF